MQNKASMSSIRTKFCIFNIYKKIGGVGGGRGTLGMHALAIWLIIWKMVKFNKFGFHDL